MLHRFGPLYYLSSLPWFFRRLRMEENSVDRVRRAQARGPVVYVLHTRSRIDWLALNRALVERRLPLPTWTNGVDALPWMPLGEMWRTWRRTRGREPAPAEEDERVTRSVAAGQPGCLFLANQRDLVDLVAPRGSHDLLPALLRAQEATARPIQLLPVVVIWDRAPEPTRTEVGRFLLGTQDNPGPLGKLWALGKAQGDPLIQVGEPVALTEARERLAEEPPARRTRALRLLLRRYLWREQRVVRGPRVRPLGWVKRQVIYSREVQELIDRETAAGRPREELTRQVVRTFDRIAARFNFTVVRAAAWATRQIWNRIYSGIDIRPEDLERIRAALRGGTPVLVSCHRSHLDYLLISSLLYDHDIVIPHIVAGENLSFWPLGAIFRACGAFFVKRSFAGDRVFPVVFERYVQELLRMGVPVEFFIEGGRSRTGKLLPPKLGVLDMVVSGALELRSDQEVTLLPIYVGYEEIAEERAYARELQGARKEQESVGQVVKAGRVLFERYGKVYLRVGEPLSVREALGGADWKGSTRSRRGERLMSIAEHVMFRINREAVALPTSLVALAILAHPRRGLRHEDLVSRVARLRTFLASAGVNEGSGVAHVEGIVQEALQRFTRNRHLVAQQVEGQLIYTVVPERRTRIEYYKNAVLHAFAPAAWYASAIRLTGGDPAARPEVHRLFGVQHFLLRYEFMLDPDADEAALAARAERDLVAYGALDAETGRVVDADRLAEIANLTANFLESYLLVLRTVSQAAREPRELSRDALRLGTTLLAADELVRPEALNLQNLDNAARAFKEDGVFRAGPDGRLTLDAEAGASYLRDLARLLDAGRA